MVQHAKKLTHWEKKNVAYFTATHFILRAFEVYVRWLLKDFDATEIAHTFNLSPHHLIWAKLRYQNHFAYRAHFWHKYVGFYELKCKNTN